MAKNNALIKNVADERDFDFSDFLDDQDYDDFDNNMMSDIIKLQENQIKYTMKLARLAIENSAAKERSVKDIFVVFEEASKIMSATFSLNAFMDKISS